MKIEIYGKQNCPACVQAKNLAGGVQHYQDNVIVAYYDVGGNADKLAELKAIAGENVKTIPQIVIDDKHIGGIAEFRKWISDYDVMPEI